jgi:predicted lipoprotein with Yx(FWY)xxD motif
MTKTRIWALTASFLLLSACATAGGGAPVKVSDGVFTNEAGMSLYTFDRDVESSGKSVCNGPCAVNWPPLLAGADARASGDWSIVTRDDGARQWAYKGKPVYLWAKDTKPGDRTGQGVNNLWQLARP